MTAVHLDEKALHAIEAQSQAGQTAALPLSPLEDPEIIWSPRGDRLLVRSGGRHVRVLDARTAQLVGTAPAPASYLDRQLWSPDGRRTAVPTADGRTLTNPVTHHNRMLGVAGDGRGVAAWSPDGRHLLAQENFTLALVERLLGLLADLV